MINSIASLSPAFTGAAGGKGKDQSGKIKDAAQQFEGLMIGQLLKTAREASGDGGWFGTGDDATGQMAVELAEQQLSMTMAKQGGFGLSSAIVRQLSPAASAHAKP
jgi:flagellar protein FlgJ